MDLSALRKFEVSGPDAEELLQRTCTRNIRKLSVGQVVYTAMCYDHGGMLDDGTVFKMTQDNYILHQFLHRKSLIISQGLYV